MTKAAPLWLVLPFAAGVAVGGEGALHDPHLSALPRTAEEAQRIAAVLAPPQDFTAPAAFEDLPAGAATVRALRSADAFSHPAANLGAEADMQFRMGNGLFRKLWVAAPSSTEASDGLGPLYNARACQSCHIKDGRGRAPDDDGLGAQGLLLRLADGSGAPDPVYGHQLQDFATPGLLAEGQVAVDWQEILVPLSGGERASLRRPVWQVTDLGQGPLAEGTQLSARMASQMIGLGLLEAIPSEEIIARADPQDADGDGISGRAHLVSSVEFGQPMLGRFGWKAAQATVREQSAAAFANDMGLSTPLFPAGSGDCTSAQDGCLAAPLGGAPEVTAEALDLVAHYARNLGVPARRGAEEPEVLAGKAVFHASGCAACHTPAHVTARLSDRPEQSFQLIWPYSDLLLHDMGEGLADLAPEGGAEGREWRTAPLWGIGLTEQVTGAANFLHDGRARSILEAILWHGGEAAPARDRVIAMPPEDRAALIRFVESL